MARSSEAPQEDLELVIERVFEAPPALVFKMWSDVEHLVRWHGPEGLALLHCEQDFREGGKWRRCMSSGPGHAHWISGEYREIRPHTRLSFTYINAYDDFETLVVMDFTDLGGRTAMHFRQSPFISKAECDGHGWGWRSGFELLAAYVALFEGVEGAPRGAPRSDGVAEDIVAARRRQQQHREEAERADTAKND
ncbi:MAG: SRPBCC domain-containing protein [Devosia sp.]|nr:SRPBCC domain-containing protein [Devosia sp.]